MDKAKLIEAMRGVGDHSEARRITEWIERLGREVSFVDCPSPRGGTQKTIDVPRDWRPSLIGLAFVDDAARELLPEGCFVAHGVLANRKTDGSVECVCRFVSIRSSPGIPQFWSGFMAINAALQLELQEIPGPQEVEEALERFVGCDNVDSSRDGQIEKLLVVYRTMFAILNRKTNGLLRIALQPIAKSFANDLGQTLDFLYAQVFVGLVPRPESGAIRCHTDNLVLLLILREMLPDEGFRRVIDRFVRSPTPIITINAP